MSVPVDAEALAAKIAEVGPLAYLVTVTPEATPHVVSVLVECEDGGLAMSVGRRTSANLADHPTFTLVWPSADGSYSLIVDGTPTDLPGEGGGPMLVRPTDAVFHRVAGAAGEGPTCVPVTDA